MLYSFAMIASVNGGLIAVSSGALTVRQVAERLNVNERTVYRMAQAGEIPAFKVAGTWRVIGADLDAWIEKQKTITASERQKGER